MGGRSELRQRTTQKYCWILFVVVCAATNLLSTKFARSVCETPCREYLRVDVIYEGFCQQFSFMLLVS